jgi:hypothetical protein
MYTDLYLLFADEAEADAILYTLHPEEVDEEGVIIVEAYTTPNYANIDTLGILYVEQPIPDPENPPEPIPEDGWHVNVRLVDGEDAAPLEPFCVHPTVPRRVWG